MCSNPGYFNISILDTLSGEYHRSISKKTDYYHLFDYYKWDENEINNLLANQYGWEKAIDTDSTWRIGDGTASFYNYIYYTVAGFSEFDTFRSNQIREGLITRETALKLLQEENKPRFESMKEYANLVGFSLDEALTIINNIPKLY